jgi:hypothetical protein
MSANGARNPTGVVVGLALAAALSVGACSSASTSSTPSGESTDAATPGTGPGDGSTAPNPPSSTDGGAPEGATNVADAADALSTGTLDAGTPETSGPSPRQLDIPPRIQWPNANGYCGETSVQSIALYYGTWVSQQLARTLAGGTQVLIGTNSPQVLQALNLAFTQWDNSVTQPQFEAFMVWLKSNLALGYPAYFGAYLTDGNNDPDYDHIMPATGIAYTNLSAYDPNDVLTYNDNFGDQIVRPASQLSATRAACSYSSTQGGCIPQNVDYGIAVTGVVDPQHVTLPVSLSVASPSEPNVSQGASPVQMTGTVTVTGLSSGVTYSLFRYDDYTAVPSAASAAGYASSSYTHRTDFTATGSTWTLVDPNTFTSDGSSTYRCVAKSP